MTRRENSRTRRRAFRNENSLILVVCGARSTEPAYFRGLKKALQSPSVKLQVKTKTADPMTLVKHADKLRAMADYDSVWCVTDVDEFDIESAVRAARGAGINLAVSNPCFEYWLILHFEDCTAYLDCYDKAARRLRRHVPAYNKNALNFAKFESGIPDAVARGRRRHKSGEKVPAPNPSTTVWMLVEEILTETPKQ